MHYEKPQQNINEIYDLHFNVNLASANDLKDMIGNNDLTTKYHKRLLVMKTAPLTMPSYK